MFELAQGVSETASDWGRTLVQAGSFGVLAWVIKHVFEVLLPKQIEAANAVAESFKTSMAEQRKDFLADAVAQRSLYKESVDKNTLATASCTAAIHELKDTILNGHTASR